MNLSIAKQISTPMNLATAVEQYLALAGVEHASHTKVLYRHALKDLVVNLDGQLTVESYADYLKGLLARKSVSGYQYNRSRVRAFFVWCVNAGIMTRNLDLLVSKPRMAKPKYTASEFMRQDEYEKLKLSKDHAARWIFILGYASGQRMSDLCQLEWRHVDLEGMIINWEPMKAKRNNGTAITVILPDSDLHRELLVMRADRATDWKAKWVCPKAAIQYQSAEQNTSRWIRVEMQKCGVDKRSHDFRRSMCSRLVNTPGVSLATAMAITGHKTVNMLMGYVQPDTVKIAEAQLAAANYKPKLANFPRPEVKQLPLP